MAAAFRVVDRLSDLSDLTGDFQNGEVPSFLNDLWTDILPISIPFTGATSGNASIPFDLSHTLDNSAFGASSSNHPDFSPFRVTSSHLADTANIASETDLVLQGPRFRTVYGSPSVDARGSARALTLEYDLLGAAQTGSTHYALRGYARAGTAAKAPVARLGFQSVTVHGPIGVQATHLGGISALVNKYHSAAPTAGNASVFSAVTRPGSGLGADQGHSTATSHALAAGMQVAGFAGPPGGTKTRGFTSAFIAGGRDAEHMQSGETSILGAGFEARDTETAGVLLHDPLGATAKGIHFSADTPGRGWQWLMYFEEGAATAPTAGALQLPGANSDAGQIRWGTGTTAPHLFRQADYTLGIHGALRVQVPDTLVQPIAQFGTASDPDPQSIDLVKSSNTARLFVVGSSPNAYLSGTLANDAGIAGTNSIVFGTGGTARGALRGSSWGFGIVSPTSPFHVNLNARFQGQARFDGGVPAPSTSAGVYPGVESGTPRIRLANGTSAQDWIVDNVSGALRLSVGAVEKATFGSAAVTLTSIGLTQTGAGVANSFGGNLSVTGTTTLGTATGLMKRTSGLVGTAVAGTDYESALGNPAANGRLLSSDVAGSRSWIAPGTLSTLIDHNQLLNLTSGDLHIQYLSGLPANPTRNTATSQAATAVPLTLKGHASQSAPLFVIANSANAAQQRSLVGGHWEVAREVRWMELPAGGSAYVALKAPDGLDDSLTWTLPAVEGTAGQVLTWNTGGALTWADPGTSGDISGAVALAPATSARNVVQPSAADATALTLKEHATQSADLLKLTDAADADLFAVFAGGGLFTAGGIVMQEPGGADTVTLAAPALAAPITLTLPVDIQNGLFLSTDASGNLSWQAPSGDVSAAILKAPDGATRNLVQATGDYSGLILKETSGGQTVPQLLFTDDSDVETARVLNGAATFVSVTAPAVVASSSLTVGTLDGLLKAATGVVSAAAAGTDYEAALGDPASDDYLLRSSAAGSRSWVDPLTIAEPPLGNPAEDGYVLSSLADGTRSWIEPATGGGTLDGGGTADYLPLWTDTDTMGDSILKAVTGGLAMAGQLVVGSEDDPVAGLVADFYSDSLLPSAIRLPRIADETVQGNLPTPDAAYVFWRSDLGRVRAHDGTGFESVAWLSDVPVQLADLAGLDQDVLPNHLFKAGHPGGDTMVFGTLAGDVGSIIPTSHPSGGRLDLGPLVVDTMNNRLGFGTLAPAVTFHWGPGTHRFAGLGPGFAHLDANGDLGIGTPGGGLWEENAGNNIIYPDTIGRMVRIGTETQWVDRKLVVQLNSSEDWRAITMRASETPDLAVPIMDVLAFTTGPQTFGLYPHGGAAFGAASLHASSMLDVASTDRGTSPFPPMTEAQRDAIPDPRTPLWIWNTDEGRLETFDGTSWKYFEMVDTGSSGSSWLIEDLFSRTSSTTLGTADSGQSWTMPSGTWGTDGDEAYIVSTTPANGYDSTFRVAYITDAGATGDGTVQVTYSAVGTDKRFQGPIFRFDPSTKIGFMIESDNSHYQLREYNFNPSVSFTEHDVSSGVTPTDGDVIKVHLNGSSIEWFVNEVSQGSISDATNQTVANHGLGTANTDAAQRFGDFRYSTSLI